MPQQRSDDRKSLQKLKKRVEAAQRLVRAQVPPGVSLVDELIADRRAEAKLEPGIPVDGDSRPTKGRA